LQPGSVAVVCGLSASIPRVAKLLGVSLSGVIPVHATLLFREDSYDPVFVITRVPSGPPTCVELRYGAERKVEAGK
jgi:hypothetical protein